MTHPADASGGLPAGRRNLLVIGASTGGLQALRTLVSMLPEDLPAAVLLVMHVGAQPSILPSLLTSWGRLPAVHARDDSPLQAGCIQVAPPDHHLLVVDERIRLSRGPKEHHSRPAIDPLFRAVALCCGPRVIGVILSGHLDDGTAGLQAIKACGGIAVVQDPADAQGACMRARAARQGDVDHCVPMGAMARLLPTLVTEPAPVRELPAPIALRSEHVLGSTTDSAEDAMRNLQTFATPSTHSCPECGGVLWEVKDAAPPRFRCHTGHAFTLRTLAESRRGATEEVLQNAIRALQEQVLLLRQAATASRAAGAVADAAAIENDSDRIEEHMRLLRKISQSSGVSSLEAVVLPTDSPPASADG